MKTFTSVYTILFLFVLAAFFACSKTTNPSPNANADAGCIQQVQVLPGDLPVNAPPIIEATPITQQQIDTIKTLFATNNLPANQYQFVYYSAWAVSADSFQVQTTANPFVNGLPVFADQQVFNFINGIYSASSSYLTTEVAASNDTAGHQRLTNLRNAFLQHVSEAVIYWPLQNAKPTVPSPAAYADTCLWATLGYIDQSAIPGNPYTPGHLIKVWQVTPANSNYPTVFVRDDNGQGWGAPVYIP
jgi:hypothetical protein